MKRAVVASLLAVSTWFSGTAYAGLQNTLGLKVMSVDVQSSTIEVQLESTSSDSVRVWRDSNTWGAARWRVLRTRGTDLTVYYQEQDELFTRNIAAFDEISKSNPHLVTLDLRQGNWRGSKPGDVLFKKGDTLIVVYDVPPTAEAHKMNVYYGVVAASWLLD